MGYMKKIALIPIDNRPICHTLVEQICAIHKGIELFLPPRGMLGGLVDPSDIEGIFGWLERLPQIDYVILSLDTVAYGGLVNSRRCPENYDEILARVKRLEAVLTRFKKSGTKVYAFSSIMRISNNNINEEEKPYWSEFGKQIFEYSYNLHKSGNMANTIPEDILHDYLATRRRNFLINKYYLELARLDIFDTLVYSKDDTGEFGLNVLEAEALGDLIESAGIENTLIKTGADEIPLTLLARAISGDKKIGVAPIFLHPEGAAKISKYEDIALNECVKSQLSLAGVQVCGLTDGSTDLNFIINNFSEIQGDLVLGEANPFGRADFEHSHPYFIADVNNANGADFGFVEALLSDVANENFYGYCGYNTSANSIGCAVCTAVTKFFAVCEGQYDDAAFKKLMLVRFLDDWAYQAKIRKKVREEGQEQDRFDITPYKEEFAPFEQKICEFLGIQDTCTNAYGKIDYELPWKRSFEIEIKFESEE